MNRTRFSAVLGVAAVLVSFLGILGGVSTAPWFSWASNDLSDLGISAGPERWLFNYGLILSGIVGLGFLPALCATARHRAHRLALVPFAVAMVAVAGVGVFPADQPQAHALSAVTAYVAFVATPVVYGVGDLLAGAGNRGAATIASAVIHLGLWVLAVASLGETLTGIAVPEFVGATLFNAWVLYTAFRAWR
ncbi:MULTISPECIES: DUF998 domain-containing protein [Halorussus]|uniref:DUF998 domain-containing protein n=1 Tax=Halorussus TaxID=1070314 RepID=UPI000E20E752|nr:MULTISPECIES: DUF998 domain-containing protein [Halorussus]NHN61565.1 DUF998 domain-containing protein [Halorussus sp. JP-T4]